jgi:hypothetical protein
MKILLGKLKVLAFIFILINMSSCSYSNEYRINITKSMIIDNKNQRPPQFNELYKINSLTKEEVLKEIYHVENVRTFEYKNSKRDFRIIDDNYFIVFNELKESDEQITKDEIIELINGIEINYDSLEEPYEYIIILEGENIAYILLDYKYCRLYYESENGNIQGGIK